jgi:hypothetical protein
MDEFILVLTFQQEDIYNFFEKIHILRIKIDCYQCLEVINQKIGQNQNFMSFCRVRGEMAKIFKIFKIFLSNIYY